MGLDIYFRLGKGSNFNEVEEWKIKQNRANLKRAIKRGVLKIVKNSSDGSYAEDVRALIKSLSRTYYGYDWRYNNIIEEFTANQPPVDKLEELLEKCVEQTYSGQDDAYFRKFNFIYEYFFDRLKDEECEVYKSDVASIIERCDKILENHSLAPSLLPTRSGFFFGSTEYDKYYFDDVEHCKTVMSNLLKKMEEHPDLRCFVAMSW